MGYQTRIDGILEATPRLTLEQVSILNQWSKERHEPGGGRSGEFPSYWCEWVPTKNEFGSPDGRGIQQDDEGDRIFYAYEEWLIYLIENFFKKWDVVLNGTVRWQGEDSDDRGAIFVKDNEVQSVEDTIILAVNPFETEEAATNGKS